MSKQAWKDATMSALDETERLTTELAERDNRIDKRISQLEDALREIRRLADNGIEQVQQYVKSDMQVSDTIIDNFILIRNKALETK